MALKFLKSRAKKRKRKSSFTNRLAIYIMVFLAAGMLGGFVLAWRSITYGYTGALACWSICFTPIGTATSIVLSRIVDKNRAENTGGNGDGITFASAQAKGFVEEEEVDVDSPKI